MASLKMADSRCLILTAVSRLVCHISRGTAMQSALVTASTRSAMILAAWRFSPLRHSRVVRAASR